MTKRGEFRAGGGLSRIGASSEGALVRYCEDELESWPFG